MPYTSPLVLNWTVGQTTNINFPIEALRRNKQLGWLDTGEVYDCRNFEEEYALIDEDEWEDRIKEIDESGEGWLERRIRKIKNQGSEGTCVYNMAALMQEITWNQQFGDNNWIELSPISGYRWNAPSPRTGSSVPGSLDWLLKHGILPVNSQRNLQFVELGWFKHTHPATGYYNSFQSGWQETALLFRAYEYLKLTSVKAWVTALLKGFPCGGGRDRHAICHVRPVMNNGNIQSIYANSWGNWGFTLEISDEIETRGFGIDTRSKIEVMVSRGAYAVASMRIPDFMIPYRITTETPNGYAISS